MAVATPALAALIAAGVPHEVVKFGHDPRQHSFGVEAVHALTKARGIAAEQIYKTLIIAVPDGLAVAIVPASSKLSLKAAAAALGVTKASMAEPAAAQRATGYVVGAVSPFGQRVPKLGLLEGGNAVVVGAGAMGLMHAELALRYKPKNLLVCDILAERLATAQRILGPKAKQLGVNLLTVNSSNPDALKETLMKVSDGAGADDIILAVGIQPVQQAALELLGRGGVANLFGGLPRGKHMLQIDAIAVHYNEIKVVGSSGGDPSDLASALDLIAKGHIDAGNYVRGIGSLKHALHVLGLIQDGKMDGKAILYPHAQTDDLRMVEYWDAAQEAAHLETYL